MASRYWPLWAMLAFVAVIVLLIGWLALWGVGGEKRSLAFRNLTQESITVHLESGQTATIKTDNTHAFSIAPGDFPQTITIAREDGSQILAETFTFAELKERYDFRLVVTPGGIITPVPAP